LKNGPSERWFFFLEKKISPLKRPFFKFSETKNNSRKKVKKLLKIKKCFKLSEIMVGFGIRGAKKYRIPDPRSGSATLVKNAPPWAGKHTQFS
jgi:hypothetical protein